MILIKNFVFVLCCVLANFFDLSYANDSKRFFCLDGQDISFNDVCNGIADCTDKSDERFQVCARETCDGKFRCNYGGCIDANGRCNGTTECWDKSDENKYECVSDADEIDQLWRTIQGNCPDEYELECKGRGSVQCLPWSKVCNGVTDCSDGKDEEMQLCSALPCSSGGFRCAYGGCISAEDSCNHIANCRDGSDEFPDLCLEQKPWSITPRLYDSDSTFHEGSVVKLESRFEEEWSRSFCVINDQTGALIAEDYITMSTYTADSCVGEGAVVRLSCRNGYELFGSSIRICDGTNWNGDWPKCVRTCRLTPQLHLSRECSYNDRPFDCDSPPIWEGTKMNISCAPGYEDPRHTQALLQCNANGKWDFSDNQVILQCKPKCGTVWDESKPEPWIASLFQRKIQPHFTFKSHVTILSPYVVVTSANMFEGEAISGVSPREPLLYAIAEGKHTKEFSLGDLNGYVLHNISQIHLPRTNKGEIVLAIISVVQPFLFGGNLKPICLAYTNSHGVTPNIYGKDRIGDSVAETLNDDESTFFLSGIVADAERIYPVSPFHDYISKIIERYQPHYRNV